LGIEALQRRYQVLGDHKAQRDLAWKT
jgi:hypothetical protein